MVAKIMKVFLPMLPVILKRMVKFLRNHKKSEDKKTDNHE